MNAFLSLLAAEWRKISKNYLLVSFTLWIIPVGLVVLFLTEVLMIAAVPSFRDNITARSFVNEALWPWRNLTAPQSALFRLMPLIFMAVVFTSEYTSGMWKNILPGHHRWAVLTAKAVVVSGLVWVAQLAASVVSIVAGGVISAMVGLPFFPEWTATKAWEFAGAYLNESFVVLLVILFLTWFSAMVGVYSRSGIPAVAAGLLLSGLESVIPVLLRVGNLAFGVPDGEMGLLPLYFYTPSFSFANLRSWWVDGAAFHLSPLLFSVELPDISFGFSSLVAAAWILGLAAVTLLLLQRQDITS